MNRALLALVFVGVACSSSESTPPSREVADTGFAVLPDSGDAQDAAAPDALTPDGGVNVDTGPVDAGPSDLDIRLAAVLAAQSVPQVPLQPLPAVDPNVVALGRALFYDPILSGNKDTACASCHQVESGTADGLPLALGTGAEGRGAARAEGNRPEWVARHTPELWNRGRLAALFWDGRVDATSSGGVPVPAGVTDLLAVQAVHPILAPDEMLGLPGDQAVDGTANEFADLAPEDVFAAVVLRLEGIAEYQALFEAAYPGEGVTMARVLDALAVFQRQVFDAPNTPWDRYLAGDLEASNEAAKLGAIFFFESSGCGGCHSGPLFSDGEFHNIGIPQIAPIDRGREEVVNGGAPFAFRTAPLRNAVTTPPFMHNGALEDLFDVLRHYSNPEGTSADYAPEHLPPDLEARIERDPTIITELTTTLSSDLPPSAGGTLTVGLSNLRQFLLHLVDEEAVQRSQQQVPSTVPSGLVVGGR